MTEKTKLANELYLAISDNAIVTRYHAILFCYGWFKEDNKRSIPFWAIDLIDEIFYEGYLKP